MQLTQQVYVTEEWVRNAHDKAKAEPTPRLKLRRLSGPLKKNTPSCSRN